MKTLITCIFYFNVFYICSQGNWQVVEIPIEFEAIHIRTLYYDSLENSLWLGGDIRHVDSIGSVAYNFVLKYDGTNWKHYGPFLGQYINSICRYQDKIVIGGSFWNYQGSYVSFLDPKRALAYIRADTVGSFGGNGVYGLVAGLHVINDELYVFGAFDTIAGVIAHNVAKFNGTVCINVFDFPSLTTGGDDGTILFCGDNYNNKLYVAGQINDEPYFNSNGHSIAYYEDPDWELAGGGIILGLGAEIRDMVVFKEELYVGGVISKSAGNAGNSIQKWNGLSWTGVGDDIRGENGEVGGFNPIEDLEVHNNELYIVGYFDFAGEIPARSIVKWDGEKYCSFGGFFDYHLEAIAFMQETLYVAGSFYTIDGIQTYQGKLAKYIGGNSTVACTEVGIIENDALLQLDIYPSPANSSINIYLPSSNFVNAEIEVYNLLGQKVMHEKIASSGKSTLNIRELNNGQYFVIIKQNEGVVGRGKFLKE